MPVFVGEMSTEVTATDGDLPLSPAQLEALVRLVVARIDQLHRERQMSREATAVRSRPGDRFGPSGGGD